LIIFAGITLGFLIASVILALMIQEKTHTRDMMETVLKEERQIRMTYDKKLRESLKEIEEMPEITEIPE